MANQILQVQGTSVSWGDSGFTYAMDLTGLATSTGRKGVVHDFTATSPRMVRVQVRIAFGTGPTSGNVVPFYWASSYDNSVFDGNLASADAAASDTDIHRNLHFIGNFICDNVTTVQIQSFLF
jgi:hypothetical protein